MAIYPQKGTRAEVIASMNSHHRVNMRAGEDLNLEEKLDNQGYDSLDKIELAMSIENDLGIAIPDDDIIDLDVPKVFLDKNYPE